MVFTKSKIFKWLLLIVQMALIAIVGLIGKDVWYVIIISLMGICFNLLVSYNISYGFLIGAVFAIGNGINAYYDGIYATFFFMIIMQTPMAIFSYFVWRKNQTQSKTILKTMTNREIFFLFVSIIVLGVVSFMLLRVLKSKDIIPDTIFFVFSVLACILLALRYKNAYIVTLLSGIGGIILWSYKAIIGGNGVSLAVFYAIVTINSIIAIVNNYKAQKVLV